MRNLKLLAGADNAKTERAYVALRKALDSGGITGYWEQKRKLIDADTNADFYAKAVVEIHLGNTKAALDLLQESFNSDKNDHLSLLLSDEYWDALHNDRQFNELLDKVGLSKVMPRQALTHRLVQLPILQEPQQKGGAGPGEIISATAFLLCELMKWTRFAYTLQSDASIKSGYGIRGLCITELARSIDIGNANAADR